MCFEPAFAAKEPSVGHVRFQYAVACDRNSTLHVLHKSVDCLQVIQIHVQVDSILHRYEGIGVCNREVIAYQPESC